MVRQESFELLIVLYLFLAGTGAGAVLTAVILDIYQKDKYISFIKAASLLGAPFVCVGCLFLLLDLGQGLSNPLKLIFLFLNPFSVISWGTTILTIFIILSIIYALNNYGFIKIDSKIFKTALIIFAIGTACYTAVLLASLRSIPFWQQSALPLLFIISAISCGISASLLLAFVTFKSAHFPLIDKTHTALIAIEIFVLASMFLIAFTSVPETQMSAKSLLTGKFAFKFWFWLVAVGLTVPLTIGIVKTKDALKLSSEIMTLAGGFFLRYLIVYAGVFIDKFV